MNNNIPSFPNLKICYDTPEISSDSGLLFLAGNPLLTKLSNMIGQNITDTRNQSYVQHSYTELVHQRILQIIGGYEDCNDSDILREDKVFQTLVGKDCSLGSHSTMTRLENSVGAKDLIRIGKGILDGFIDSYSEAPELLVIDMDPSAHLVYGDQQQSLFNTHVGEYCLMPFYVFEGVTGKMMTATIRPGKTPTAIEILSLLKRIVRQLRSKWPNVKLLFRGDSHHTKPAVMDWMEENRVDFITGLSPNSVLNRQFSDSITKSKSRYESGVLDEYDSGKYAAGSWSKKRHVVCRIKSSSLGTDVRYIVTSLKNSSAKYLYEAVYCDRGNCENYIKDMKLGTISDRSSCTSAKANQFRLFLHAVAYAVLHNIREKVLKNTSLKSASIETIRLKLLKVASVIEVKKTVTVFHFPEKYKYKSIHNKIAKTSLNHKKINFKETG